MIPIDTDLTTDDPTLVTPPLALEPPSTVTTTTNTQTSKVTATSYVRKASDSLWRAKERLRRASGYQVIVCAP